MPSTTFARRGRGGLLTLATATVTALALVLPGTAAASPETPARLADGVATGTYLVQLADEPVAAYEGRISGYRATRPAPGTRVDRDSADAKRYAGLLRSRHDAVLSRARGAKKVYDYTYAFNGFAAKLTGAQAATLRATAGVVAVTKSEMRHLDTTSTPDFLKLTGSGGVWQKQFGGPAKAGDGVIVGIVDSGLWPESASFAPLPASPTDAEVEARFNGTCDAGIEPPLFTCNNKVIGGRWFVKDFGVQRLQPEEYLSPRDYGGHGTHTASTAAGNNAVPVNVEGNDLGKASGMAPAARVSVYKVCWNDTAHGGGCATGDMLAAIDAAVGDGVDVINFSISGTRTNPVDPVEVAYLNAAKAGVFVAASAGNSGPGATTVAHNSPWLTTVAAGTHDRASNKTVTLGNGASYTGPGLGPAVPSSPLVTSTAAAKAGAPAADARLCFPDTLDPAKATGKIVICDRGVNARTEKSKEVQNAGGVGMVLTNTAPSSLNADLHFVPTVHVDEVAGAAIKAYAATTDPTAALSESVNVVADAPKVATFSSRGPALAGSGDLLKPDIMAPGVDVLAAVAPPGNNDRPFDFYSGTSMSSPHIAGLAALVIGKYPKWSPMAVKSALMTTASVRDNRGNPITNDTGTTATPLDYGSGQVTPANAFDPGLVYDSGAKDWTRYLCGVSGGLAPTSPDCTRAGGAIDPSDLNVPSIAIGALAGVQTVTRKVTNVSTRPSTYVASISEPAGIDITASPSRFTIAPGQSKTVRVTITRVSAAYNAYAFGAITWLDGRHSVRSPIVVRPVAISAPVEVSGTGTDGSQAIPVTPGFTGTLTAAVAGLDEAQVDELVLAPLPVAFNPANPAESVRTKKVTVTVPAGTMVARFATYDADYLAGTDLDVFVYRAGTKTLVGRSAGPTSQESVTLNAPSGQYDVYVDLFSAVPAVAKLHSFAVGPAIGNATVTPASQPATIGTPTTVTVRWTGLTAGRRWFGAVT
ncbi:MAG TPA: S8 family serine peptidase [Cryptosporangiaceae bacterium]|nr:S8 family serine peptidase [Cryptosporangiaceae bacterium]